MDTKLYSKDCITLDGCMDEPVWETVEPRTNFKLDGKWGGGFTEEQTIFKIIPCEDRIYIGVKCMEPDMAYVTKVNPSLAMWLCDDIELFLAPSGNGFDFYQFAVTFEGETAQFFYSENGNIKPDPYAPEWKSVVYRGEDFWSVEIELPLTAFYMTPHHIWSDTWLVNLSRSRTAHKNNAHIRIGSSWSNIQRSNLESHNYRPISGFPIRPVKDDVRMYFASTEITEKIDKGFCGTLTVKVTNPEDEEFELTANCTEPTVFKLQKGDNVITVPCCFGVCGRHKVTMQLKRLSDGRVFKRYYPMRITYEAIKLEFIKPEFRTNFYPGQDYSQVVGKVTCAKSVTMKLEGPGIETQIITPDADGTFCFDTTDMEEGEALLTVTGGSTEVVRKIRRLAPRERMMSWISNGNLIINGKPVFARTISAEYWNGGEAFKRKYDADDLHINREIVCQRRRMQPDFALRDLHLSPAEASRDEKPREEIFRHIDMHIEENKDRDFAYYDLSDEPECRNISPVYLKCLYDYIAEKDPYHVVRISSRKAEAFVDVADLFDTHPYINPYTDDDGTRVYRRPFATLGNYVDDLANMNRKDKCVGFICTCFAGIPTRKDPYPTFDEYICNSWCGIIHGAKSLRQYAYHDLNDRAALYEGTRYIFSSVERLEEVLLRGNRKTLHKTIETECCLYELNGEKLFVLVNFTQDPQTVTVNELAGTWHNFRHNSTVAGPTFQLRPIEVLIGTNHVMDAGMATYQETVELIDRLETERLSNKSLLFQREKDIKVTTSSGLGWKRKLFDGIKDSYAWSQNKGEEKFYEIDITKVKPAFNKVVISGRNIDNMEIRVRTGGELSTPAIVDVQTEEYTTIFTLKETVSPDALRLEFHKDRVELYEVEIFQI